ncbi:MAG TPA: VWA domain-containing protein [Candidatus Omnitrophota bacterium]|nr:VWA domain-containing protein [Candidatus Omnitrophota bacterium]
MNWPKKPANESRLFANKHYRYTALFLSLGIHLGFIITSNILRIPGVVVPPSSPDRLFQVKIARDEAVIEQPLMPISTDRPEATFRFETPSVVKDIESFLEKERTQNKPSAAFPEKMEQLANPQEPIQLIEPRETDSVEYDHLRKKIDRPVKSQLAGTIELNYRDVIDEAQEAQIDVSEDFIDKMPGFTPALVKDTFEMTKRQETNVKQRQMPVISRLQNVEELKTELIWTLGVYQDPKDQQKYFKITIRAGEDNKNLKTDSKEVIFLVDCSNSVEEERLEEFKKGIAQSLALLNENDLFNVIMFKEIIFEFQQESVPPTQVNIDRAIRFIERFRTAEKTDVFEVLSKSIHRGAKRQPAYLILLSDGHPTKGLVNPREVINKISKINNGKKAIYTLSGGLRVNRYMLDFIAYKNRGWSEYSSRTNLISQQIMQLSEKIDDPIILNLRYYFSGLDEGEVFPHILPDFFRGAEFSLYGTYDKETEFAMQLLGEVEGKTKEYILKSGFDQAYLGDEDIARNWAYNKLFDLISQLRYEGDNTVLINEINVLSEKFSLKTPYLEGIIK